MENSTNLLVCDGCGRPASPEHVADRIQRLELATKYRPIHIGVLFVTLSPPSRPADDFYGPAESKDLFDPFLEALEIPLVSDKAGSESGAQARQEARLVEFQRRGYYLVHLSECPLGEETERGAGAISRLGATLVRRIRYNYKPKGIAVLGYELTPLIDLLKSAGVHPLVTAPEGAVLPVPKTGDTTGANLVRRALAAGFHRGITAAGL